MTRSAASALLCVNTESPAHSDGMSSRPRNMHWAKEEIPSSDHSSTSFLPSSSEGSSIVSNHPSTQSMGIKSDIISHESLRLNHLPLTSPPPMDGIVPRGYSSSHINAMMKTNHTPVSRKPSSRMYTQRQKPSSLRIPTSDVPLSKNRIDDLPHLFTPVSPIILSPTPTNLKHREHVPPLTSFEEFLYPKKEDNGFYLGDIATPDTPVTPIFGAIKPLEPRGNETMGYENNGDGANTTAYLTEAQSYPTPKYTKPLFPTPPQLAPFTRLRNVMNVGGYQGDASGWEPRTSRHTTSHQPRPNSFSAELKERVSQDVRSNRSSVSSYQPASSSDEIVHLRRFDVKHLKTQPKGFVFLCKPARRPVCDFVRDVPGEAYSHPYKYDLRVYLPPQFNNHDIKYKLFVERGERYVTLNGKDKAAMLIMDHQKKLQDTPERFFAHRVVFQVCSFHFQRSPFQLHVFAVDRSTRVETLMWETSSFELFARKTRPDSWPSEIAEKLEPSYMERGNNTRKRSRGSSPSKPAYKRRRTSYTSSRVILSDEEDLDYQDQPLTRSRRRLR